MIDRSPSARGSRRSSDMFSTPSLWLYVRQTLGMRGTDRTGDDRRDPSASRQRSLAAE